MTLPGAERAFVDPRKVRDYLLNPAHRVGFSKARFFAWLGYTRAGWARLYEGLLEVALTGEAVMTELTTYGQKWEVHATIRGPAEREAFVLTVWIILSGEDFPRLVTAFPGGPR